jgi:alpha-1,3-rhamnosyl/mannosyltransferase
MPLTTKSVAWLQLAAPNWLRGFPGIFHSPFNGLPYWQPVPMVVTIHDISFVTHPQWFSASRLAVFRAQARHAVKTARRILTVSEQAREAIIDFYRADPARILVAPNAVDPVFHPTSTDDRAALLRTHGLQDRRYIVTLGGAERRGAGIAIEAWRRLKQRGLDTSLVIVGAGELSAEPGLHVVGLMGATDLGLLFGGALAFCYPTEYESFGLPALEAVATGAPVVCARVGALPEVLGPAARWVDERSPEAFADALESIISDSDLGAQLRQAGLSRAAAAPGWEYAAAVHFEAYRGAAG